MIGIISPVEGIDLLITPEGPATAAGTPPAIKVPAASAALLKRRRVIRILDLLSGLCLDFISPPVISDDD
jgi:hypothetical protein